MHFMFTVAIFSIFYDVILVMTSDLASARALISSPEPGMEGEHSFYAFWDFKVVICIFQCIFTHKSWILILRTQSG